ncbi:unnamed protein product, partial [Mycena citricolor]
WLPSSTMTTTTSAFFYGTLMHPKILKRVIGNDGAHLLICPAILMGYTRHQVKHADYPGVLPYSESRQLFDHELDRETNSVRGAMVTGLTHSDMALLDTFEGDEYTRSTVPVYPLEPLVDLSQYRMLPETLTPLPGPAELPASAPVDTYIFKDMSRLVRDVWDLEDFVNKNAWKWYGDGSRDNPDFTEVDRRQAASRMDS